MLVCCDNEPDGLHHTLRGNRSTPVIVRKNVICGLLRRPSEVLSALDFHYKMSNRWPNTLERTWLGHRPKPRIISASPRVDGEGVSPRRPNTIVARVRHGSPCPHAATNS